MASQAWASGPAAGSHDRARLVEAQPTTAREQLAGVAVAKVAEEVGLHVALREELLVAALAVLARREELLVQLGVVEARHRTAVQAQRARGHDHVGALERRVAPGGRLDELGRVDE